jgi:hypothetical protein
LCDSVYLPACLFTFSACLYTISSDYLSPAHVVLYRIASNQVASPPIVIPIFGYAILIYKYLKWEQSRSSGIAFDRTSTFFSPSKGIIFFSRNVLNKVSEIDILIQIYTGRGLVFRMSFSTYISSASLTTSKLRFSGVVVKEGEKRYGRVKYHTNFFVCLRRLLHLTLTVAGKYPHKVDFAIRIYMLFAKEIGMIPGKHKLLCNALRRLKMS